MAEAATRPGGGNAAVAIVTFSVKHVASLATGLRLLLLFGSWVGGLCREHQWQLPRWLSTAVDGDLDDCLAIFLFCFWSWMRRDLLDRLRLDSGRGAALAILVAWPSWYYIYILQLRVLTCYLTCNIFFPFCSYSLIMSSYDGSRSPSSRVPLYLWGGSKVPKKRFVANLHRVMSESHFQKWRATYAGHYGLNRQFCGFRGIDATPTWNYPHTKCMFSLLASSLKYKIH